MHEGEKSYQARDNSSLATSHSLQFRLMIDSARTLLHIRCDMHWRVDRLTDTQYEQQRVAKQGHVTDMFAECDRSIEIVFRVGGS